jgi:pectate lyase
MSACLRSFALGFALLSIPPARAATAVDAPEGFATVGGPITGGAGGPEVVVTTAADLKKYADSNEPCTIYVQGTIPIEGMDTHVRPNKTILGLGSDATLVGGGLYLYNAHNVIVRNLTIKDSSDDGLGMLLSTNVWIDHCTFLDSRDGNLDVRRASDNITVSWCKFAYTKPTDHALSCLLGSNDDEIVNEGKLHLTFHHNWFAEGVKERMPSIRFGTVHLYNNYYSSEGNNYCIRARLSSQARIENNSFEGVKNPWELYITSPAHTLGRVWAQDNLEVDVIWGKDSDADEDEIVKIVPGTDEVFAPPYDYAPQPASEVKAAVTAGAGAGRLEVKAPDQG